eukprot:Phypoly_transcript_04007.p1 GENE.Phypoly_transcript_04007~~Phypoly_transcript_04007.p1  ORF type:complete len:617 (+),score=115.90 Phypoly_transcript_04007:188-2038(+)
MFKHEKLFVNSDVIDRVALCKRLTDNGATIVSNVGEQDSVHIFNSFEGGLYEDCVKKGCRVIGLPCLQETLRSGKTLPRASHPIYSRVMEGIVVSGDVVEEKAKLKNYVNQMNGTWSDELTGNTQYFITTEPGSMHYLWALELGSNIVQPSWITESWENRVLSNPKSHLLPPLSGCVISVTGLSSATRATIQNLVVHYGGKYLQQLSRKVTHLLCDKPKGRKYVTALAWGINIVTTNWLFDSVNMKGTADVSRYELPAMPPDLDGLGSEALYIRSPYARTSSYTPLSSAARSRLNNYASNAPILVRRHRNPLSRNLSAVASYTAPIFSMPSAHSQQLSSHSHHPVFAQTTQIQSGQSSHSSNSSLSHSLRQQSSMVPLHQNHRYATSTRSRDKEGRTVVDRYREMFDQLTGLLRMCDDVIDRCGPFFETNNTNTNSNNNNPHNNSNNNNFNNINNNNFANFNNINDNNNNISSSNNNNNNKNSIKGQQFTNLNSNISTLANLYNDIGSICTNTELATTNTNTNLKLAPENKVTTLSDPNNDNLPTNNINNNKIEDNTPTNSSNQTSTPESTISPSKPSSSTSTTITNQEENPTDLDMESEDEGPTATPASSSEQEK